MNKNLEGFTPISSDHIDGAKYNSMDRRLTVKFKNGYVYDVHDVSPKDHQEFMNARSQGVHFHNCFKGNYHIERVK